MGYPFRAATRGRCDIAKLLGISGRLPLDRSAAFDKRRHMSRQNLFAIAVLSLVYLSLNAANDAKRRAELEEMLRVFPKSAAWEQWLQKSGELPPDFEALLSEAFLPDPLKFFPRGMMGRDLADSPDRPARIESTPPPA